MIDDTKITNTLPPMEWVRESPCRVRSSLPPMEWVGESPCGVAPYLPPMEWVGDSPCRVRSSSSLPPMEWVGDSPYRVRSSSSLPPMEWGETPLVVVRSFLPYEFGSAVPCTALDIMRRRGISTINGCLSCWGLQLNSSTLYL
ncbi:hypothetical protein Tco_0542183 [Tanacetum coccineum]